LKNRLHVIDQEFELVRSDRLADATPHLAFSSPDQVLDFLRNINSSNPSNSEILREILSEASPVEYVNELGDSDIIFQLAAELMSGRWKIILPWTYSKQPPVVASASSPTPNQVEQAAKSSPPPKEESKKEEETEEESISEEDAAAQAAVLEESAKDGTPICSECCQMESAEETKAESAPVKAEPVVDEVAVAQAATLDKAAEDGTPVCSECSGMDDSA
jgi:hypothetical protein